MAAGATERESRYTQFGGRHRRQLASSRCPGQPKFLCDLRRDQNSYLQPLDEQLTLRATWGEGFREPSLEELFGSPVSTLEVTHDPLKGGLLESETNTLITSNPNLQPEDSRSFSGGFVYSPKYAPGLNVSVDFWDIERTGVLTAPSAHQRLDGN